MEATATVAVHALADAALSPASVLVPPGQTAATTLTLTSHAPGTIGVSYTARPPAGITVTPTQGSVTVPATGATSSPWGSRGELTRGANGGRAA